MPHPILPAPLLPGPKFVLFGLTLLWFAGCTEPEPIRSYVIPTKPPKELRPQQDRMLAAIVPSDDRAWFFKVTGPDSSIRSIEQTYRDFVQSIRFRKGEPDLDELPPGWRLGGKKAMRFATVTVDTPQKQLDISVSSLTRQRDWDEQVAMNVNRWRGQLGLESSAAQWAGARPLSVEASDGNSVWVDLVGTMSGGPAMSPPMLGGPPPTTTSQRQASEPDERLKSKRPEGWRDGKKSSMRWASFRVGPEDAEAEVTVIPAGGDTRGNVERWIGQIRAEVNDEIVDLAMKNAKNLEVGGRDAQRFILEGDGASEADRDGGPSGQSIDATIVPLEETFSLFIKMTGPTKTVNDQHDALTAYLESLEF